MKHLLFLAALALFPASAHAVARPGHQHDDLFGEEDILVGFKFGPELTGYTSYQTGTAVVSVQSSMRLVAGAAFKFVYGLPRFEIDAFWNARASLNSGDTYHALALPILAKIPWEIEKGVDLEFGAGYEPDLVMFGPQPHRSLMNGILGSIGLSVEYGDYVFDFEGRYNVGLETISDDVNGARPRDLQILAGFLWHF